MTLPNFAYALMISTAAVGFSLGAEYMETKPDFIKTCKLDAEFEACLTENMQILFERFSSGTVDGLSVPIDPVKLKKINLVIGNGPVSMNTTLSKVDVTGLSNIVFVRTTVNPDFSSDIYVRVPKLKIEGNYDMNGKVMILPVVGRGKLWMELHDLDVKVYTQIYMYEKYNHTFCNITELKVDFNITGLKMHLDNLFDGIKVLGDGTNAFLNKNWREVSEAFKPIIRKSIEHFQIEMMNKIFNFIPLEYVVSGLPPLSELYGTSSTENYKQIISDNK